ncbi:MAG: efflux RND transporter permease subunit [Leptolyngbyaceae cyanobacterium bins.59]|nr:efflux RND transporter permease subunit [Leptolyngbyaceae cyanobacterium bins.59]
MNSGSANFSLSALSIRRHIGTLMLTLAVIILGVFFVFRLQVDLLPAITYPRIGVEVDAPGISPEVAIDEITRPLEEALTATQGVQQIFSRTREGRVRVDMFFAPGSNIDQSLNDATAAYNRARNQLPDDLESPRIFKIDPSQLPVYEFALTSNTLSNKELRIFADEELGRELSVVPGVAGVDVAGGVREEVRVKVDLDRLQAMGVGLTDVLNQLTERNQDISGGRIQSSEFEPLTRTIGRFQEASEIENLSFEVGGQTASTEVQPNLTRRVYMRDFAQVIDDAQDQRLFVFLADKNSGERQQAVKVSVQKQPDANTIEVVDGVKKRIEELRQAGLIPEGTNLLPTLDESFFIRNAISNVTSSGLVGALLAGLAVLLFLGSIRQTLIIVLAIPLGTLAAIVLMGLFDLSLNLFSLGGLALGVGSVVDCSIVMMETIAERLGIVPGRDVDLHLSREEVIQQAEESSQTVESALIASTSTNLVSVLPFLLLGGFVSLLFNELILTISFSAAASILVAVTVVPALASRLFAIRWSSNIHRIWPLKQFTRRFEASIISYGRFLRVLLRHQVVTVIVIFAVFGVGGVALGGQLSQELLPRINTGQVSLIAQFPPGIPLETNLKVTEELDKILLAQPGTEYIFTTAGGNLFGRNTTQNALRSSSTVTLKSGTSSDAFITQATRQINQLNLAGVRVRLTPGRVRGLILNNSPAFGADIDLALQGPNLDVLQQATRQVLQILDEKVPAATFRPDADPRQPEVQVRPDWERAALVGITAQDIGRTVETAIVGSTPTQLQRGNRLVDVRVQLDQSLIQRPSQLGNLPLFIQDNRPVRLSDVARIEEGQAPGEIQRINQRDISLIIGNLSKGASLGQAITQIKTALADVELPDEVRVLPSSAEASNQQLQQAFVVLGGLAIFLVFVVMAVQYNSLVDPFVILFTVPLALVGGMVGLYIARSPADNAQTPFDAYLNGTPMPIGITVLVGVVLMIGIVVNNAIVMVEMANQIREGKGVDRQTAILIAAPQRLRPILMTTITTVLGTFPLALGLGQGAEFLQPLGVVVFAGLSLATLLTLFLIPCLYVLLHDWVALLSNYRFQFPKLRPLIAMLRNRMLLSRKR